MYYFSGQRHTRKSTEVIERHECSRNSYKLQYSKASYDGSVRSHLAYSYFKLVEINKNICVGGGAVVKDVEGGGGGTSWS